MCFVVAMFFAPLFLSIPAAATTPVLVIVGLFMLTPVKDIDLDNYAESIPAFITIVMMPLTYSISDGILCGVISYVLINSVNPAGLTGLDSLRLVADATAFVKNEWYSSRGTHTNATSGNLSSFSMGGRIMPRWYMSAGVYPYSTVGYYFRTKEPVEGTDGSYYYSTFEGSGGLSTASLSNAILLNRHLSLGVTLSYVFGNITQTETQESMTVAQKMYTNAFNARFGLQYTKQLANDLGVTVGLTFGYKQKLVLDKVKL
jgi:hypothetical protein